MKIITRVKPILLVFPETSLTLYFGCAPPKEDKDSRRPFDYIYLQN